MTETTDDVKAPLVRVLQGAPTPEEIAAIAVVMLAAAQGAASDAAPQRQGWSSRSRTFNPGAVRGAGWGGGF